MIANLEEKYQSLIRLACRGLVIDDLLAEIRATGGLSRWSDARINSRLLELVELKEREVERDAMGTCGSAEEDPSPDWEQCSNRVAIAATAATTIERPQFQISETLEWPTPIRARAPILFDSFP